MTNRSKAWRRWGGLPLAVGLLLAGLLVGGHIPARATSHDNVADRVLGQPDFTSRGANKAHFQHSCPRAH